MADNTAIGPPACSGDCGCRQALATLEWMQAEPGPACIHTIESIAFAVE
jgi:hypothetical protein